MDIVGKLFRHEPSLATGIIKKLSLKDVANCRTVSKQWRVVYNHIPTKLQDDVNQKETEYKTRMIRGRYDTYMERFETYEYRKPYESGHCRIRAHAAFSGF